MVTRALTKGEIEIASALFGDAIDYTVVTISDKLFLPGHPRGTGMSPNGHMYMPGCYSEDYSEGGPGSRSFFIHEMAHVWQYQNKVLNPLLEGAKLMISQFFNYAAAYPYTLEEKKDLLDYNMEQQASIIEEYFELKFDGVLFEKTKCQNDCGVARRIALYENVLEKFLTNPNYARQSQFPRGGKPKPPTA